MYRNCVYNNRTKSVHLWTWDETGNRVKQEIDFKPYLYLESKNGEDKSIYGTILKKKEFETAWERNKFVENSGLTRLFENLPPYQQFLIDNYYYCCEDENFAQYPLKIMFFDIECPAEKFPDPETAEAVINLLTCYDNFSKKYTMFGLKHHQPTRADVTYIHCKSEHELLKSFIKHVYNDYPDCLVGYNSAGFDIPYLVNRITFELGKEWADKLSPMGRIYEKINKEGKFGMPTKEYVIEGISCIDYYVLYKKFAMTPLEAYKLDYVAESELDEKKVEYSGSLWDLCRNDWDTYCQYNLIDVELMVKLDHKLRYIELLRFISYLGLCSMESAVRTVAVINGAVAIRARYKNERIPTFIRPVVDTRIPGAYVAEPKVGFSENIVSFDANSLYPSVMISLNMSPETKYGSMEKIGEEYHVRHVSGRTFILDKAKFTTLIKEESLCKSEANILFKQKKKGLMPEFLDFLYNKRKEMKAKMGILKKEFKANKSKLSKDEQALIETEIQKCDTFQHAYKIILNSTYGYCANKHAPLGDLEIGESVTLTGQSVIKKSNELVEDFITKRYPEIKDASSVVIYNDTDSVYLSLKVMEEQGIKLKDVHGKISEDFYNLCNELENYINIECNNWAIRKLWSKDPRFVFKRESICDSGIFLGKKYYALHILDDEGLPVDKFKYKGVDIVKTTMPKDIKPYVKKIMENMILTRNLRSTNELFTEASVIFKSLGPNVIYKNQSINNYEKYASKCNGISETVKCMPAHVKAAYHHNLIMEQLGLTSKYEKIKSGEKVKTVYLKTPNKFGIKMIGFKGKYPDEFSEHFEIDYDQMFDKIVFAAVERFYEAVRWPLRKPNETVKIELEDFFS